ncbi:MAG: ribosome silencing factor [Spirochaetota bacterium]
MKKFPAGLRERPQVAGQQIVLAIAELLRSKKARDIIVLDLEGMTSITDYFVICTVNSIVHSKALVRSLFEYMEQYDLHPLSKDPSCNSPWVLIDYNYFIIHIFLKEGREYYQLEKLWSDAPVVYFHEGGEL